MSKSDTLLIINVQTKGNDLTIQEFSSQGLNKDKRRRSHRPSAIHEYLKITYLIIYIELRR